MAALRQLRPVRGLRQVREGTVSYLEYSEMPDDGQRYEVANGNLEVMSPAPAPVHQFWVSAISDELKHACISDYVFLLAPVDVILGPKEVRQPDIVGVKRDRMAIITKRGVEGPPDLVVEVLSTYSAKRDKFDKLEAYARYGIQEYWIVSPELLVLEKYVLAPGGYLLAGVYAGDDVIESDTIPCARFSMEDVRRQVPELRNA